MDKIPTSDAAEGMKLARDVMDDMGRTILAAGTVLSASHCKMLARREIEFIMIHGSEAEAMRQEADDLTAAVKEEAADNRAKKCVARVQHMFVDVMDSEPMQRIFRLALEHARKGSIRG